MNATQAEYGGGAMPSNLTKKKDKMDELKESNNTEPAVSCNRKLNLKTEHSITQFQHSYFIQAPLPNSNPGAPSSLTQSVRKPREENTFPFPLPLAGRDFMRASQ